MGAGVVCIAVLVLTVGRRHLEPRVEAVPAHVSTQEAEAILVGDLD